MMNSGKTLRVRRWKRTFHGYCYGLIKSSIKCNSFSIWLLFQLISEFLFNTFYFYLSYVFFISYHQTTNFIKPNDYRKGVKFNNKSFLLASICFIYLKSLNLIFTQAPVKTFLATSYTRQSIRPKLKALSSYTPNQYDAE